MLLKEYLWVLSTEVPEICSNISCWFFISISAGRTTRLSIFSRKFLFFLYFLVQQHNQPRLGYLWNNGWSDCKENIISSIIVLSLQVTLTALLSVALLFLGCYCNYPTTLIKTIILRSQMISYYFLISESSDKLFFKHNKKFFKSHNAYLVVYKH